MWCEHISSAVVFKYVNVEQIKHEWIGAKRVREMEECAKTEQGKAAWVITQADFYHN